MRKILIFTQVLAKAFKMGKIKIYINISNKVKANFSLLRFLNKISTQPKGSK